MAGLKKEPPKFSQFDEEFILKALFPSGRGRCVDIGARGRSGSNVAWAIDRGWRAQLYDRDVDQLIRDFKQYPKVTWIRKLVTPQNVNEGLMDRLDLMSIDIDGNDAHVWDAVDPKSWPLVLVIEINGNREQIEATCQSRGYRLHQETGPNLIWVR